MDGWEYMIRHLFTNTHLANSFMDHMIAEYASRMNISKSKLC